VEQVLAFFNRSKNIQLVWGPTGKDLKVKGDKLRYLSHAHLDYSKDENSRWSILTGLDINTLDISNTDVFNLYGLRTLHINGLDIGGTLVNNLLVCQHFPKLKVLFVDSGQFTTEQLSVLPLRIKVVIQ
jgi:hypothetical protein